MPQVPASPTDNKVPAAATPRKPLIPPEESMWKRYSPHHEFGLSNAVSWALHILAGALILVVVPILAASKSEGPPQSMEPVVLAKAEDEPLKNQKGGGGAGGKDDVTTPEEDTGEPEDTPKNREEIAGKGDTLSDPVKPPKVKVQSTRSGTRTVVSGNVPADLDKLGQKAFLVLGDRRGSSKAKRSKDSGDGSGGGKDKGTQGGSGEDVDQRRAKRQLRWRLTFNRDSNGPDYRDKLRYLGAILVVAEYRRDARGKPMLDAEGKAMLQYRLVIRDIRQGARPREEDVRQIPGIFWIDDKRDSVTALADALGIQPPPLFACFFPRKVEEELRRLEKQKYGGPEDKIERTLFHVEGRAGKYHIVCDRVDHR
jgi:hypothetical protein